MPQIPIKKATFKGSRIPVSFLIDYLQEGLSISDFLSAYPWIKKESVVKVLEELKEEKISSAHVL